MTDGLGVFLAFPGRAHEIDSSDSGNEELLQLSHEVVVQLDVHLVWVLEVVHETDVRPLVNKLETRCFIVTLQSPEKLLLKLLPTQFLAPSEGFDGHVVAALPPVLKLNL